ncbi:MAG TPA: lamin tail domain-containing protein [Pyrinomonadaceae bacterium]|nr:lamin tail domain-containing protein [Pyrinomonadaceae bacterium]
MLQRLLLFSLLVIAVITIAPPLDSTSTVLVRRITFTSEQSLNLNAILSRRANVLAFESTSDIAELGGAKSFHSLRANMSGDNVAFTEFAKGRSAVPALSSDGSLVAFSSSEDLTNENADHNYEIYLASDSGLKQLTHSSALKDTDRPVVGNFQPSINGDGSLIAFSASVTGSANTRDICLVDRSSGQIQQLTNNPAGALAYSPKISNDGSMVYFIRESVEGVRDLVVVERITGKEFILEQNLADLTISDGPALSDDGTRLVYSTTAIQNQSQVHLYDRRAGTSRQLTHLSARATDVKLQAAISGDGLRVTFVTRRRVVNASDGSVELYLIDLPTGETQQLTNAPAGANAEIVSSLNEDGSLVLFNFPRVLSGPVSESDFVNNSEIYLASVAPRPAFGKINIQNAAGKGNEQGAENSLARGSLAIAQGTSLALSNIQINFNEAEPPTNVLGTTVQINGLLARLLYVSPDEVVFVVPESLNSGDAEVVVTNADGFSSRTNATITESSPGTFTRTGDGKGAAVALNADNLLAGPFDPASGRLRIILFCTGVLHANNIQVQFGGFPAAVEAVKPSSVPGIDEVHVLVPELLRGAGPVSVIVEADGTESNPVSVTFSGSALRDLTINEFLADPPDGTTGDANHDGIRDSSDDEFVEIVNTTSRDLDLTGFQLQSRSLTGATDILRHRFAAGTVVSAGTAIVIFGAGSPNPSDPVFAGAQIVKASSRGLSLTNSGGVITLRNSNGTIITSVTYGSAVDLPADQNQSLTRSPDIDGQFTLHTVAAEDQSRFSPGTRVDKSGFTSTPAIANIVLNPVSAKLIIGETVKFSAVALDESSAELGDVIFKWHSSNLDLLQIDDAGLAKAIAPGTVVVTATARGTASEPSTISIVSPSPSPTPTPTPTPSPSPSSTPTPTPTPLPTATPSPTPTPTPNSSPSPSPSPTPVTSMIVISEFRTRGPNGANDEFVEIFNKGTVAVDVGGWKLRGSSSSGTITTRMTITSGTVLLAGSHFLATNSGGYSGTVGADQSYSSGFANDGGIAITRADDVLVDQVGMSAGSAFREGVHLSPLPSDSNQSYERRSDGPIANGLDTQDNFSDFQLVTPSNPQNSRSGEPTPTPTPSPIPSPTPTPVASPSPSPTATPTVTPTPTGTPTPSPSPTATPTPSPSPSPAPNTSLVISQIFGGGGNSGSPLHNDFVEIFNRGSEAIDLSGWSIQYAGATNPSWSLTPLTAVVLAPGKYYLIQEASGGANGASLPNADVIGSINMAATAGKVALVRTTTPLSGLCPSDTAIVDLVGYGSSASCFRGSAPTLAPSNSNGVSRSGAGCLDTVDNRADFTVGPPAPRNTSSPVNPCESAKVINVPQSTALLWLNEVVRLWVQLVITAIIT